MPSNSQQKSTHRPFKPKPLTTQQENAIEALLLGKSDREAAELAGCSRWSVQEWRSRHPVFMAALAQRREERFSGAVDRLQSLVTKALDNIASAIEGNTSVRWSFELLKAIGVYGFMPPTGELDPAKILDTIVMQRLAAERLPDQRWDALISKLDGNPLRQQRQQELEAELLAEFGEPD